MPRIIDSFKHERFDREVLKEMGELGFLGCTLTDYDLPGVSSVAYGTPLLKTSNRVNQSRNRTGRFSISFSTFCSIIARDSPNPSMGNKRAKG